MLHANVELTTLDAKAGPKRNRITSNKKTKGHLLFPLLHRADFKSKLKQSNLPKVNGFV